MEQDSRKRGREDEKDEAKEKTSKKQETIHCDGRMNHQYGDNKDGRYELSEDELELGVFDFPWLKEGGMISVSEDYWSLEEDTFSSFLHETCTSAAALEFSGCGSPPAGAAATCMASTDIVPVEKFEENVWSLEMELGVSTLLNQPLQQEGA